MPKGRQRKIREVKDGIIAHVFDSINDTAASVGTSRQTINAVLAGRSKSWKGRFFEYHEPDLVGEEWRDHIVGVKEQLSNKHKRRNAIDVDQTKFIKLL